MNHATQKPPFPEVIDSTMLATFRSCPQKLFRMYIEHWKPKAESVHLVAGKAFARGLEVARRAYYDDGADSEKALEDGVAALLAEYGTFECPEDSAKGPYRMAGALEFYFNRYPLAEDSAIPLVMPSGKSAIEFSFAQPLPVYHPETGEPLIYAGRSDMIATFAEGTFVEDDKTTSQLGASWSGQWDLRSQFTGYCWAARESGISVDGVLVRGVSILKTKYDTLQAITYRSGWEVDRWLRQVERDLLRMIECWRDGYWDFNLDHACAEYGGCPMKIICTKNDPESWLPMYFEQRKWDPLAREETILLPSAPQAVNLGEKSTELIVPGRVF